MANILLRSPRFESLSFASADYGVLKLYFNGAGTPQYTLTKDAVQNGATKTVVFDISELARDYINVTFNGTYTTASVSIFGDFDLFTTAGTNVAASTFSHVGYEGYGNFENLDNPTFSSGLAQSNTTVYVPDGVSANIPTTSGYVTSYTGVTVVEVCERMYTPIKVTFINRFGFLQDIWFFKKSVESISTNQDRYNRTIAGLTGTYSINDHAKKVFNKNGNEVYTVNSGFVAEDMNLAFKELMLSEYVWATFGANALPINITSQALTYKTVVNDKLINYTIDFEFAFDAINDIR
jgi:hypothetical protein